MARDENYSETSHMPVLTPEDAEDELISLAVSLARQRLMDGTASNQLVAEVIKHGTVKARLEKEKLQRENELLRAKTQAIADAKRTDELYRNAIEAMKRYAGAEEYEAEEEYYD